MIQSSRVPPGVGAGGVAAQLAAHEGLVRWVVRRQWRGALPWADALHAGRVGLWQALGRYDPSRGTRFSSYAVPAIRHAVWAAVAQDRLAPPLPDAVRRGPAGAAAAWGEPLEALVAAEEGAALRALIG